MVSFLCDVHYEALDRKLTDIEIAGIVHAMILGGLETTQYALEEQAQLLCEHPGIFEHSADRPDEAARLRRRDAADALAHARPVDARSPLATRSSRASPCRRARSCTCASARRTSTGRSSTCPFDLDLDRESIARHVTFSTGPRVCPGATLSRLEQQVAWGALLDRLESIEYGDDNDWLHQPGIMLGTLELNLRLRKAAEPLSLGTGRTSTAS